MITEVLGQVLNIGDAALPDVGVPAALVTVQAAPPEPVHAAIAALAAAVLAGEQQQADAISAACDAVKAAPNPGLMAKVFANQYASVLAEGGMSADTVKVRKSEFLAILKAVIDVGFDPRQQAAKGVQGLVKLARAARKGEPVAKPEPDPAEAIRKLATKLRDMMRAEHQQQVTIDGFRANLI